MNYTYNGENMPSKISIKIQNSPARVVKVLYKYYYHNGDEEVILHSYAASGMVCFPVDDKMSYDYGVPDWPKKLHSVPDCAISQLRRHLQISYTNLSGGKEYKYSSLSKFILSENRWMEIEETAT